MKEGFRQSMDWVHTWLGLIVGWVLFFVYFTGTLGYVDTEIDYWMTPDKPFFPEQVSHREQLTLAQTRLQAVAPDAEVWTIQLIGGREARSLDIGWVDSNRQRHSETLHPVTGQPVDNSARATGGGQLLYKMHYNLAYLPLTTANIFIMICSTIMFAAMITGIIVHRNIFRDFFTFRLGKGQRSWLDGHNVLSVTSLPFHLIVTYSGLMFFVYQFMPAAPHVIYDEAAGRSVGLQLYQGVYFTPDLPDMAVPTGRQAEPAPLSDMLDTVDRTWGPDMTTSVEVRNPDDEHARVIFRPLPSETIAFPDYSLIFDGVSGELLEDFSGPYIYPAGYADQALKGLHKGLFAGPFLRILYLFMGIAGTAMIGTGLLMWSTKRKQRLLAKQRDPHFGIFLVDRLNLATVIGQPVAIAAYFWANRFLPATMDGRDVWEMHAMFITLGLMLVYPSVRPLAKARIEMLWIGALAYLLLPLVNALTTDRHLVNSLYEGDWIMAGFDLTAVVCGIIFVVFAIKFRRNVMVAKETSATIKGTSRELLTS